MNSPAPEPTIAGPAPTQPEPSSSPAKPAHIDIADLAQLAIVNADFHVPPDPRDFVTWQSTMLEEMKERLAFIESLPLPLPEGFAEARNELVLDIDKESLRAEQLTQYSGEIATEVPIIQFPDGVLAAVVVSGLAENRGVYAVVFAMFPELEGRFNLLLDMHSREKELFARAGADSATWFTSWKEADIEFRAARDNFFTTADKYLLLLSRPYQTKISYSGHVHDGDLFGDEARDFSSDWEQPLKIGVPWLLNLEQGAGEARMVANLTIKLGVGADGATIHCIISGKVKHYEGDDEKASDDISTVLRPGDTSRTYRAGVDDDDYVELRLAYGLIQN